MATKYQNTIYCALNCQTIIKWEVIISESFLYNGQIENPPYGKYGGFQVGDLQTMFVGDTDWQDPCPGRGLLATLRSVSHR